MFVPLLQINLSEITADASLLSSVAIILGAIFVVFEMRQNDKLLKISVKQAESTSEQARLASEELKQNHELANMDLIMRIYEFADSLEVQSSWQTVINSKISSLDDFDRLPERKQLAFHQIASLFESIGLLMDRGFVNPEVIDDMFATQLAWNCTKTFVMGMRQKHAEEEYYFFFEKLYKRLSNPSLGR